MNKTRLSRVVQIAFFTLLSISLTLTACNIPAIPGINPLTPTATPQPLPPALVESTPPAGSQIPLQATIAFYFSQPMERASVESALVVNPAIPGVFTWADDATLAFTPSQPLTPNSKLSFTFGASTRAANGLLLPEPVTLDFQSADYLRPSLFLPASGTVEVLPNSAITVTFNQPVVPLGADLASMPGAFTLQPAASGRGEWLNTSTCIFYPDPPLAGGVAYTVNLNPGLTSTAGSPLDPASQKAWSFSTAIPRLVLLEPSTETPFPLDPEIKLTFNQPMDTASVAANITLLGPAGPVAGTLTWDDDNTVLTLNPQTLLARETDYTLVVGAQARGQGGTALGEESRFTVRTFSSFQVQSTIPAEGQATDGQPEIFFTSPLEDADIQQRVQITPPVPGFSPYLDHTDMRLYLFGYFDKDTEYTLNLPADLKDRWGMALGEPYTYTFRTPPASPTLQLATYGDNLVFVRPGEPVLSGNAVNINTVQTAILPFSVEDMFWYYNLDYQTRRDYTPQNATTLLQSFELTSNRSQPVSLGLTNENDSLNPGLYYVKSYWDAGAKTDTSNLIAVVSDMNVVLKAGGADALVWVTDLRTGTPMGNIPVALYTSKGSVITSGTTDASGVWYVIFSSEEPPAFAVTGSPGDAGFGLASSSWNHGIASWDFGYWSYLQREDDSVYLYTDRPIYRPGQTVYFRGVLRKAYNSHYSLPDDKNIAFTLVGDYPATELTTFNLQLSDFGTFHGEYELPEDLTPGYYTLRNPDLDAYLSFQVAEYRKPEIEFKVSFSPETARSGQPVQGQVESRYYFDAPASNVPVDWYVYSDPSYFHLSGYKTGVFDDSWMEAFGRSPMWGKLVAEGKGQTDAEGKLTINLNNLPDSVSLQDLRLEVTARDESGFSVSERAEISVHPDEFYIGIRPDQYVGQAGSPLGFDVLTADWNEQPSPAHTLRAKFQQVVWRRSEVKVGVFGDPVYERVYTPVASSDLTTGPDGKARLSFTPDTPGTYALEVSGGKARTEVLLWVGGAGQAAWPDLDNQRLRLTADQDGYRPGQTAKIFIPNTFGTSTLALVTVERSKVISAQVMPVDANGSLFSLPLTDEHAPNVFISVTLLGGQNDFRQGLIQLEVQPETQTLNVALISEPERAGPRDPVAFDIRVTDAKGQPVQGEFSLSVVDRAVLALADPNAEDILPFYYDPQSLGIETSLSLAAYTGRNALFPIGGGGGGGGGGDVTTVREKFPDTAFWKPDVVTDADGRAHVEMTMPDSLTTWQVDVRGLTRDTRVGQTQADVVTTKDLLIRPVTPRFLVAGDHLEMAAIVQNNTDKELSTEVRLQATGFELDDPGEASQRVVVPAGGRSRISWWGTTLEADAADLVFSVETRGLGHPGLSDATRPVWGALPILRYTAPQTFVTAGVLPEAGSRQEIISLPRTFTPVGGSLDVELNPSLAGLILGSLEALELPCTICGTEHLLSYLLPNLEAYRALQTAGVDSPELKARLEKSLDEIVRRLLARQNQDGGWPWWNEGESDAYVSAYVLFGLTRAREAGIIINEELLDKARSYLMDAPPDLGGGVADPWQLERQVFMQYVLRESGSAEPMVVEYLYEQRGLLSPAAQALLALTLHGQGQDDPRVQELLSNLQTTSLRTASGAHWESQTDSYQNPGTPLYTTAIVVYALARRDPANPMLTDAVRYLASQRRAKSLWGSSYENAWVLLALTEAMRGSGELQASFAYNATLNGTALANGRASGPQALTPVTASAPITSLYASSPNALTISRQAGAGRLYYRAALNVERPADSAPAIKQGLEINRDFVAFGCEQACTPLGEISLGQADKVNVRITLVVPQDSYYIQVQDYLPAGSEVLDPSLKTSQQGEQSMDVSHYDADNPFEYGWGWWYFHKPQIYDDHILWSANYLPAGTYVLTYTLSLIQPGEYRVLPAHAWLGFFPEVQGTSAGTIFSIKP